MEVIFSVLIACCFGSVLSNVLRRNDDVSVSALAADVSRLASQVTSLTAELTAVKNQVTSQQSKLDTLDKMVAFHAWGAVSPVTSPPSGIIKITSVHTNVGSGLDPQTGYFTAPVSGLYEFHGSFMANNAKPEVTHGAIVVDGQTVALSISDSRHGFYDNTGIHAVVHVAAGKKVYIKNVDTFTSSYHSNTYLTFSGFLIRAD